jgi:hypothetical protein
MNIIVYSDQKLTEKQGIDLYSAINKPILVLYNILQFLYSEIHYQGAKLFIKFMGRPIL